MNIIDQKIGSDGIMLLVEGLHPNEPQHQVYVRLPLDLSHRRQRDTLTLCADDHMECTCLTCDCCKEVLDLILAEHFGRLNPDKLDQLKPDHAKRIKEIGGVPGIAPTVEVLGATSRSMSSVTV